MLCGIKLKLDPSAIRELLKNPNLEFKSLLNSQTGEVDQTQTWSGNGMKILIKNSGFGYIKGSLHKFKNGGRHNYDDFSWYQVFQTIDALSDTLGINVAELKLINLEWGVNIVTELSPKDIIVGLVMHKGVRYEKMYVNPGTHYVCTHSQFSVKAYDKGAQNHLPFNLLRIELAAKKSVFFNSLGVYTLEDLHRIECRTNLQNSLLLGGWGESLLIEPEIFMIDIKNTKFQKQVSNWSNPLFWLNSSKRIRCYQKEEYNKFRFEFGLNVKEQVFDSISKKIRKL